MTAKKLNLGEIDLVPFPKDQYYQSRYPKKQIALHHTVSGPNIPGIIGSWESTTERVATALIIGQDGKIHQLFPSEEWAHHLGIKAATFNQLGLKAINDQLNQQSIAIELVSWGPLTKKGDQYFNYVGKPVPANEVCILEKPYRGSYYYQKYSEAQLESLAGLLLFLGSKYGIPLDYHPEMWEVSKAALQGEPGVWSHVSYRSDKSDCCPQPELIAMLQSLKS